MTDEEIVGRTNKIQVFMTKLDDNTSNMARDKRNGHSLLLRK